ncbi:MAG: cation transporter [Porticoccus sp.]|mgnify:CR=1 FL=1|jgi:voltage-gated sodium channel|nr:cation transporter [Porticoccus sp.]|tara:strand:- start:104 stop:793 length:690 start_codon:yes stop_codon:yes gene_type:complete
MVNKFSKIKNDRIFQSIVIFIILLSSLLVGFQTYDVSDNYINVVIFLDYFVTIFFVFELSVRFFGEQKKLLFFKDRWNLFDTIIVLASLIPVAGSSILILRLLRIFRVLRIISIIPELKELVEALLKSLARCGYVVLILFIILYIYAAIGSILFSTDDPARWADLGISLLTLTQVMTLSSWETVMLPMQALYPWAFIYFISFVFITAIVLLNLIIAVLVDVVSKSKINK